jgi:hypothetical protein
MTVSAAACQRRCANLLGETARFLGCGDRLIPRAAAGGDHRVQGQQPRQMPQSPLRPQTIHRHREEIDPKVKSADGDRHRAEEPSSVSVAPLVLCRPVQARQNAGRMTQRIRIRVHRKDAWILGIDTPQPA